MKWHRQEKPIDAAVANPLCIVTGIELTPKEDASWSSSDSLAIVNKGSIGYDIYLRANAMYSFSCKEENQAIYGLYPFTNVREDGVQENGGHFKSVYKEFEDQYTLNNGVKDGWVVEGGGFAYYKDGAKYTGIREIEGYYYDFGDEGVNIGQKKYTGSMTAENGDEFYLVDGLKYTGWMIKDMKDVKYYNPETGVREILTEDEVPSTCIIDGYCIYTTESGEVKRIDYDDAAGHEYVEQADGSYVCSICGYLRIEMEDVDVTLSRYVYTYNGTARTPSTTAVAADGRVLTKPGQSDYPDYSSKYANNIEVGTASVTLTAARYGKYQNLNTWRGNAAGSITVNYEIRPDLPTDIVTAYGDGTATISWTAAKTPEVTYVMYRSNDDENWVEFDTTTENSYTLNLEDHEGYNFKIGTRKVVEGKNYDSISLSKILRLVPIVIVEINESTGLPTLKWTAVTGAVNYKVYRLNAAGTKYNKVFETAGRTYTHASAVAGNTYYYYVLPIMDDASEAAPSKVVNITLEGADKIAAPVAAGYIREDTGKPRITWKAVDGAVKYEVHRSEDGISFEPMYTTTGLSYTNTSAVAGDVYYYQVKAIGEAAESEFSNVVELTCGLAAPVASYHINPDYGKPRITWKAVKGAEYYEVWRSEAGGEYVKMWTTKALTYTNTSAEANVNYSYKVKAFAENAESSFSNVVEVKMGLTAPVASYYINEEYGKPRITWEAVVGAEYYEVWRSEAGGEYVKMWTTKALTYTNTSAEANVNYSYKVKAFAEGAESPFSNVVEVIMDLEAPVADYYIREDNGKPRIIWEAVSGAEYYEVWRSEEGGEYELMWTTKALTYTNTSAEANVTYYYKVKAYSEYAESSFSEVITVTPNL